MSGTVRRCAVSVDRQREEIVAPIHSRFHTDAGPLLTVSVADACRMVGIGQTRMYELIGAGEVTTIKIGRRRLVHVQSLRDLVEGVKA